MRDDSLSESQGRGRLPARLGRPCAAVQARIVSGPRQCAREAGAARAGTRWGCIGERGYTSHSPGDPGAEIDYQGRSKHMLNRALKALLVAAAVLAAAPGVAQEKINLSI